ncbi:hypothetical protein [Algoriphagus boritolerans]|uniref:hypothetical protein n=1 Tax=Algoriphagus boritolerans TaxID=308111 RepID=UPI000AF3D18E
MINKNVSEKTLNLLIKALEIDLNANQRYFYQIFQIEDFSFSNRALALNNFSKSNPSEGEKELIKWISIMDQFEKKGNS